MRIQISSFLVLSLYIPCYAIRSARDIETYIQMIRSMRNQSMSHVRSWSKKCIHSSKESEDACECFSCGEEMSEIGATNFGAPSSRVRQVFALARSL